MPDDPPASEARPPSGDEGTDAGAGRERPERDRGLGDFVRRAVSAGFEVASRSKDDLARIATTEIRAWLDRLDLDQELTKALARMVIEVKTEVRFRPMDDGRVVPEATHETTIKTPPRG